MNTTQFLEKLLALSKTLSGGSSIFPITSILSGLIADHSDENKLRDDLQQVKKLLSLTSQTTIGRKNNRDLIYKLIDEKLGIKNTNKVVDTTNIDMTHDVVDKIQQEHIESKTEVKSTETNGVDIVEPKTEIEFDITKDVENIDEIKSEIESNDEVEKLDEVENGSEKNYGDDVINGVTLNPIKYVVTEEFYELNQEILDELDVTTDETIWIDEDELYIVSIEIDGKPLNKLVQYVAL